MADYQYIRGLRVKYLSANPADPASGEVWYNSTTGTLKTRLLSESWSSAAPMVTARRYIAGFGTPTSAVAAGGYTTTAVGTTEEYNGSGWATSPGSLNVSRYSLGACGTLTAGLAAGGGPGSNKTETEEYDGSTWTANPTGLNTGRAELSLFGTQTA